MEGKTFLIIFCILRGSPVTQKGYFLPEGEDYAHNVKGKTCVSGVKAWRQKVTAGGKLGCVYSRREARMCIFPGETCNRGHVPLLRLERLWQEELNEVGPDAASLRRVVWIFCRTRLILSIVCLMITQLAGFSGPVSSNHPFWQSVGARPWPALTLLFCYRVVLTFGLVSSLRDASRSVERERLILEWIVAWQHVEGWEGFVAREGVKPACFPGVGVNLNESGSAQDCAPLLCGDIKWQSGFRKVCLSVLWVGKSRARAALCGIGRWVGAGDAPDAWRLSCHMFDGSVANESGRN